MGVFDPNIFDSNIFDTGAAAPAETGGGGGVFRAFGPTFSKKRYRELMAAIEAAREKAEEVQSAKAKEALSEATQAASVVAFEAPSEEDIRRLIALLETAANASKTAAIISKANAAAIAAKAIMEEIDDEEAILWLM